MLCLEMSKALRTACCAAKGLQLSQQGHADNEVSNCMVIGKIVKLTRMHLCTVRCDMQLEHN